MKNFIAFVIILLVSFQGFAEKKPKTDPRDAQIDSLKLVTKNLNITLDSISLELVKYMGVYTAVKEKVIHYNFDPTRTSYLIDSLIVSRDSAMALLLVKPKAISDSIALVIEVKEFQPSTEEVEKTKAVSNLKQLKELLDAKIITEAEFLTLKGKYLRVL